MGVREVTTEEITRSVKQLCIDANTIMGEEVIDAYKRGYDTEESPVGKDIFGQLLENTRKAKKEGLPLCQDAGLAVVFVELGQDVHITGGDLKEAIRKMVVEDFPAIVINDIYGNDLYKDGRKRYRRD